MDDFEIHQEEEISGMQFVAIAVSIVLIIIAAVIAWILY
jgi:hypothetical protein